MSNVVLRQHLLDLNDPPNEDVRKIVAVWRTWCGTASMPRWTDSEMLLDLPPSILSYMTIVDVHQAPRDYVFRYWGSGITTLLGYDLTGQSVRVTKSDAHTKTILAQLDAVCDQKQPYLNIEEFIRSGDLIAHDIGLRLPISNSGDTVDIILNMFWMTSPYETGWAKAYG